MPLLKGNSNSIVSQNISEMRQSGHPEAQAVAASLRSAGRFGKKKTIKPKKAGQKPLSFTEGGLHASTGVSAGKKIPAAKHAAAKSGKFGSKAKKQENFYENVLS